MNKSLTMHRLASAALLLILSVLSVQSYGQCGIASLFPEPVQIQLILDPVDGTKTLLRETVHPSFISGSGPGGCNTTSNVRFFYNANKTLPSVLGLTSIDYTCSDVSPLPKQVFVAIGNNPVDPSTFSETVELAITVRDLTLPQAVAPASITVNTDPGVCTTTGIAGIAMSSVVKTPMLMLAPGQYTDNCLSNLEVTYQLSGATTSPELVSNNAGMATFNKGVTTVTYRIRDYFYTGPGSNTISVAFTVTVNDNEAPMISCPPVAMSYNTDPGVCTKTLNLAASASDNCTPPPGLEWAVASTVFSASPGAAILPDNGCSDDGNTGVGNGGISESIMVGGIGTMNYTSGQRLSNVSIEINHTWRGDLQIALVAPGGQTILLGNNVDGSSDNFYAKFSEFGSVSVELPAACGTGSNCAAAPGLTVLPQGGTLQSVFDGVNANGNWTLQICDRAGGDFGTLVAWSLEFTDAAGAGQVSNYPFPVGASDVTFVATDGSGNSATCSVTVNVVDAELPSITCPPSVTLSADAVTCNYTMTPMNNPNAIASDNCGISTILHNYNGGGATLVGFTFPIGSTNVIWTATDVNMNTRSCTFKVTVIDDTAPVVTQNPPGIISYDSSYTVNSAAGLCSQSVTFYRPSPSTHTVVENCSPNSPGYFVEGVPIVNGVPNPNFLNGVTPFPYDPTNPLHWVTPITAVFPVGQTWIPYTFTDAANPANTTTIYIHVTVLENQNPVALCVPGLITLPLDNNGMTSLTVNQVNNGSTDNCGIQSLALNQSNFDCSHLAMNQTVTLTVTDLAGNTNTCTATVDVVDSVNPDVICPTPLNVSANSGCNYIGLTAGNLSAGTFGGLTTGQYADNCSVSSVTWSLSGPAGNPSTPGTSPMGGINTDLSGVTFRPGTTVVTYTIRDGSMPANQKSCSFPVTVTDLTGPVFDDSPVAVPDNNSTVTINANLGGCLGTYTWTNPTVSDACSNPSMIISQTHFPGSFFPFGTTTVTYVAKDNAGNLSTYRFYVEVVDTQNPVAICKNITVELDNNGMASINPADVDNNSTDNCFFDYISSSANYDCEDLGANNYTLVIEDGSGNTASCVAVVTVEDNIAPVAICANLTNLDLNPAGTYLLTANALNNGSTDNCPASLSYLLSVDGGAFAASTTFNCDDLGLHVVTLQVTDGGGNMATCTRQVNVRDVTAPAFTLPANLTIECDDSSDPADTGVPTNISDACDADPAVTHTDVFLPGACANEYSILRTWTVTDFSNNMGIATQTIVVEDNTAPVFSVQDEIVLQTPGFLSCEALLTLQLTADSVSDNCTDFGNLTVTYTVDYPNPDYGNIDITVPVAGTVVADNTFPIGTTVVVWRVTDPCGNFTTKTVLVTVEDVWGPAFLSVAVCDQNYVLTNTPGSCSNLFSWLRPSIAFNNVFDCLDFEVSENFSDPNVQQAVNLSNPYNYNNVQPFQVFVSAQFPVGITTVSYTATDDVGNTTVCSFTVEVEDNQVPVLTCPQNQTFSATCPDAQIPDYRNLVLVTDNCPGSVVLSQSPNQSTTLGTIFAPNPPQSGNVFTVIITGEDEYNSTTCSFTVTLEDGDAPIPTVAVLPDLIDSCGAFIVEAPTATDPCNPNAPLIYGTPSTPVGVFIPGIPPRYNLLPGNYVITWVYNDGNGNVSTQPQNITVLNDIFPPVALCKPGFTLNLNSLGSGNISIAQIDNGSYDPNDCGSIELDINQSLFDCSHLGVNVVVLTVTDHNGNTATCGTTVTVKDVTRPVFTTVPADETVEACDPIPGVINPIVTDVCDANLTIGFTSVSTQDTSGFGFYNYTITRTWVATDDSGNSSTYVQTITVEDTVAPLFSPNAPDTIIVITDNNSQVCSDTAFVDLTTFISDCATGDDLAISNTAYPIGGADATGIYDVGTHTVFFLAEDISGNFSTYSVVVVVEDGTPPTAVCINGVSAALQPSGTVTLGYQQFNNNSFDNCSAGPDLELLVQRLDVSPLQNPSLQITYTCADADGVTQHPVKLTVTDEEGNMSMCETYIVIQDNVFPTITSCPPSRTIQCTQSTLPAVQGTPTATDNCTVASITYSDVLTNGTGAICEVLTRTWSVLDQANNLTTCVQVLSIQDTIAPSFSQLPTDATISCSEVIGAPSVLTATDNCDMDVDITFVQDTINIAPGLCGQYSYTVRRTRTATDDCGNSAVHTRFITVVDNQAPQFLGLPDTITFLSSNFPPNLNCTVPVAFNLSQFLFDCAPVNELLVTNDAMLGDTALNVAGNYPVGEYVVHFSAADPCGNISVDSILLMVVDNSIPTAICNGDVVVALGTNGEALLTADDIDLGSTDNCGIDTMFLSQDLFDCSNLGFNPVTLTVVDFYGNSNSCTVDVEVTPGNNNIGFTLATSSTPVNFPGAADGSATATPAGGSGDYGYGWSNGDTTATITGLTAGFYIVTVTDNSSGCIQIDTVEVEEGEKLKLIIGNAAGAQGATVSVPVTVENFVSILGFTFSVDVTDMNVGSILGISNVNPALVGLNSNVIGGVLGVLWSDPLLMPVDLPNGSLLFNVDVFLGNAPVGSVSPVIATDAPIVLEFLQDQNGTTVDIMIDTINGTVEISDVMDNFTLAGDIKTWQNPENPASTEKPVANVIVNLGGGVIDTEITDVPGTYDFSVMNGINTVTSCIKSTPGNAGITSGDLLRIVNHIFGDTFPSPYQWVAADVNNSNTVSLADYLLIQRVVLGTDQHIMNQLDWKFIPKSYVFPANNTPVFGPLTLPYPQSIFHSPVDMDYLDDDFVAVRMGDVNGNTPVNFNDDANDRYDGPSTLYFQLDDRAIQNGETILVPFMASDFRNRQAYQMTIVFDPSVFELEDILPGQLPNLNDNNFGTAHLAKGFLTTSWVNRDPASLQDGEVLFTLQFRALSSRPALSGILHAGSQITRAETYNNDGTTAKVDLRFNPAISGQAPADFALYQNVPNPFRNTTTIAFRLPENSRATLRVFNTSGQLVKMVVGNFDKGYNEVTLRRDDLGAPGVYWYELETPTNSDHRKMIFID